MLETNPFVIREMVMGDIPPVLEIEKASYPASWTDKAFANEIASRSSVSIVAMETTTLVG